MLCLIGLLLCYTLLHTWVVKITIKHHYSCFPLL